MISRADLRQRAQFSLGAIALLVAIAGCGPSKTAQCREILQTIQDAESEYVFGRQSREAREANRQLHQALATDLADLNITAHDLQAHQERLAAAYGQMAIAQENYLDISDEDGHVGYIRGDEEAEAAVKAVMAEQQRATNKIDTAMKLFYIDCRN